MISNIRIRLIFISESIRTLFSQTEVVSNIYTRVLFFCSNTVSRANIVSSRLPLCCSQVWDYSISQATLETIFMSFAKNQEEEVASIPGVTYTDTTTRNDANHDTPTPAGAGENSSEGTRSDARHGAQGPPRAPTMDVEMGWMGESRSRRKKSSNESVEDEGESAAFV